MQTLTEAKLHLPQVTHQRNPGMPLDLGFLESMRNVNRSALERRVASLTKRRSIKADNQAAWLLRAVACMDLTTLNSNDTDERVRRHQIFNPETVRQLRRLPPNKSLKISPKISPTSE